MSKILKVAQREYIATVKTKAFIIGLFIGPIIIGVILYFSSRADKIMPGAKPTVIVGVTDVTGELAEKLTERFEKYSEENPDEKIAIRQYAVSEDVNSAYAEGKKALRNGAIGAYFVIEKGVIIDNGNVLEYTYKAKPGSIDAIWQSQRIIKNVIIDQRCVARKLAREELNKLWWVNFDEIVIGDSASEEKKSSKDDFILKMMMPFAMMFLIYIGIVGIGQHILSSVIEEKNSRIIEVLLSALSPFELMSGKILGLVGAGMTVMAVWCLMGFSAGLLKDVELNVSIGFVLIFTVYYILGFMFFSALLAGIGSLCNTIKESQSLMMPIVMVLILPMISWYELAKNPNGLYARILSFIPPVSPLVMVLRLSASSDIALIEVIISIFILMLGVLFAFWLAGRVFETGILMYGKKPKLKEIFRWLREG